MIARGSMLLQYFVKPKKLEGSICTVFPLGAKSKKRKKEVELESHEVPE